MMFFPHRPLERRVRHVGGDHALAPEEHGVVLGAQDDGVLEQDGQRVQLVQREVQHDALRHERVAVVALAGEHLQGGGRKGRWVCGGRT